MDLGRGSSSTLAVSFLDEEGEILNNSTSSVPCVLSRFSNFQRCRGRNRIHRIYAQARVVTRMRRSELDDLHPRGDRKTVRSSSDLYRHQRVVSCIAHTCENTLDARQIRVVFGG